MILATLVCLWLLACAIYDLKSRTVPLLLTLPPLFIALLWQALNGQTLLALFVMLLFILADVPPRMRGFATGLQVFNFCVCLAASPEPIQTGILLLTLFAIWFAWIMKKLGGADAQTLMALALLFGPAILLPIILAGGVQGLICRLVRKKTMPCMLSILAGVVLYFLFHPPTF